MNALTLLSLLLFKAVLAHIAEKPLDGQFSVPISADESITVTPGHCDDVCPPDVHNLSRRCYRYASQIPSWQDDQHGPYLSYPCLVCLNIATTLHSPTHYEVGNSLREAQDLVDAIWATSRSAGIPPQIPLAGASGGAPLHPGGAKPQTASRTIARISSYASDVVNRAMGRVRGGFMSRTCCARCDEERRPVRVWTCTEEEARVSDFCGDRDVSFQGAIG